MHKNQERIIRQICHFTLLFCRRQLNVQRYLQHTCIVMHGSGHYILLFVEVLVSVACLLQRFHFIKPPISLTILTFLTLESSSTQTAVASFSKTGLTGCVVLARVINTSTLNGQPQNMSTFNKRGIIAIC